MIRDALPVISPNPLQLLGHALTCMICVDKMASDVNVLSTEVRSDSCLGLLLVPLFVVEKYMHLEPLQSNFNVVAI